MESSEITSQPQTEQPISKEASKEKETLTSAETNNQQEKLMDFSTFFKRPLGPKPARFAKQIPSQNQTQKPNWLLQIPSKVSITLEDIKERRVFDTARWKSTVKATSEKLSGVYAIVSIWNYMYSKVGVGSQSPITSSETLKLLNSFNIDSKDVSMISLMDWFKFLCERYSVKGQARMLLKSYGEDRTDMTYEDGLAKIQKGLKDSRTAYIYRSHKQCYSLIGFEITPSKPLDAYKKLSEIKLEDTQVWISLSSHLRADQVIWTKKWKDICVGLGTEYPNYFDIIQSSKGVQTYSEGEREESQASIGTNHDIIQFINTSQL